MANYETKIKTNFFRVKDEEEFRELMSRVYGEGKIDLYEAKNGNGNTVFSFGTEGAISGLKSAIDDDCDPTSWAGCDECPHLEDGDCDGCPGNAPSAYDEFIDGLQNCVADDDAIIITEIGSEKLRVLGASATIITSSDYRVVNLADFAQDMAQKMLGDKTWVPMNDY